MKNNKVKQLQRAEILAQDAALLSLTEIGLGSILHGPKIPFTGYFLSLNQIFILARSSYKTGERLSAASISLIAALLKSLSPAGKKLTPMLAISAQGLLFSLGTMFFGINIFGITMGSILSSLWSFIQPFVIYPILFGQNFWNSWNFFLQKFLHSLGPWAQGKNIMMILIFFVIFKAILAIALSLLAYFLPESYFQRWQEKLISSQYFLKFKFGNNKNKIPLKKQLYLAWTDLWQPLFILSLVFNFIFLYFVETNSSHIWVNVLRPLAFGFLLFLMMRLLPWQLLLKHIPLLEFAKNIMEEKASKQPSFNEGVNPIQNNVRKVAEKMSQKKPR